MIQLNKTVGSRADDKQWVTHRTRNETHTHTTGEYCRTAGATASLADPRDVEPPRVADVAPARYQRFQPGRRLHRPLQRNFSYVLSHLFICSIPINLYIQLSILPPPTHFPFQFRYDYFNITLIRLIVYGTKKRSECLLASWN